MRRQRQINLISVGAPLLLPAVLRLFGRHAWWLPSPLARLHGRIGLHEDDDSALALDATPGSAGAD